MIQTSVVIPTYKRCAEIGPIVDRVLSDSATDELVVVIDGCDDGTLELLRNMERTDPRIVPLYIENQGDGRARQAGIARARGEIIVMIDDDVLIEPGAIAGHAHHHRENEGTVLLGYMPVRLPHTRKSDEFYLYYYMRTYDEHVAQWEREPATILEHFWSGHASMRRSDALAVGIARSDVKLTYHADFEFGLRCRAAGLVGHFDRDLRSEHLFRRSLDAFVRDAYIQGVDRVVIEQVTAGEPDAGRRLLESHGVAQVALVAATRRDTPARFLATVLRRCVEISGHCHAYPLQMAAGRLLQRIHQLRGIRAGLALGDDVGPRL